MTNSDIIRAKQLKSRALTRALGQKSLKPIFFTYFVVPIIKRPNLPNVY